MAIKQFTSKKTIKFDVDFSQNPVAANDTNIIGYVPGNSIITDGWAVIKSELGDADEGDDTTLSIGLGTTKTALYPATSIASMDDNVYLKLIPGVLNIKAGEALTTVDTPAEIVALGRNSGETHGGKVLTTNTAITLTAGNDKNINAGTMSIYLEYFKVV
jgi:hypothetical protein